MICYRDMTFCISPCANEDCPRRLTPTIESAARRWWGSDDAPMSLAAFHENCPDYKTIEDEDEGT